MFERSFQVAMRCGSRILFGFAAILFLIAATHVILALANTSYSQPLDVFAKLFNRGFQGFLVAAVWLFAALVIHHLDRWATKRDAP